MYGKETRKTILLIDDDVDEQQFVVDAFAEVSPAYQLVCFDDGRRGLLYLQQLAEDQLPCLIILDYDMPGLNGADVFVQLQQMPRLKDIPVVIHSSSVVSYNNRLRGARALVKKGSTWSEMKENINAFLFYRRELAAL